MTQEKQMTPQSSFGALLRKRRQVFGFKAEPIPEKILTTILEDAIHVPSAGFTQDFDLIVVKDVVARKRLAEAARESEYKTLGLSKSDFISTAPVIVVPCANKKRYEDNYGTGEGGRRLPWWLIDASFASLVLILSAFEHGLAASFLGALDDEKLSGILDLPKDHSVIPFAIVPMGYKSLEDKEWWDERVKKVSRSRRRLDDVVHWDRW
jgi:nitroreductase